MVDFFFILADVITILFAILIIILLVYQWVIYFRVEKTILSKEGSYEKEGQNTWRSIDDSNSYFNLTFNIDVNDYTWWSSTPLVKAIKSLG